MGVSRNRWETEASPIVSGTVSTATTRPGASSIRSRTTMIGQCHRYIPYEMVPR